MLQNVASDRIVVYAVLGLWQNSPPIYLQLRDLAALSVHAPLRVGPAANFWLQPATTDLLISATEVPVIRFPYLGGAAPHVL